MAISILCSADWHILLHKKKMPFKWQLNRFRLFFAKLLFREKDADIHIVAGDIFDKKPREDEVCLFLEWAHQVSIPTYITTGNHDATKKGESFLESFKADNVINNPLVKIITKNERIKIHNQWVQFFPYGSVQLDNLPTYNEGDILVTHVRGNVPPHITAEYDFEKLRPWKLILLGDLHFRHKYQDYPAYYPGSPMNVVFDRDENRSYGINIIDFTDINNYKVDFIDLNLPKLIRKTVVAGEKMIKDDYDHVIYEVTGSIDELSSVENHELLDKKIAHKPKEDSALDLSKLTTIREELKAWLEYSKMDDIDSILKEYDGLNI